MSEILSFPKGENGLLFHARELLKRGQSVLSFFADKNGILRMRILRVSAANDEVPPVYEHDRLVSCQDVAGMATAQVLQYVQSTIENDPSAEVIVSYNNPNWKIVTSLSNQTAKPCAQ